MPEEYRPPWVRRPHKQKLDYVALPPKEAFYSSLYKEHVSNENYEHALRVFNTLLCVLFKDYPLIHLQKDVLWLADEFLEFQIHVYLVLQISPGTLHEQPVVQLG